MAIDITRAAQVDAHEQCARYHLAVACFHILKAEDPGRDDVWLPFALSPVKTLSPLQVDTIVAKAHKYILTD